VSIRVLLVPHKTGLAHTIPLVALHRMLRERGVETAFQVAPIIHDAVKRMGVRILPVEHRGTIQSELNAYRDFEPDVVIDDCSPTTGFAAGVWGVPRITIQRTGTFPSQRPGKASHRHSLPLTRDTVPDLARWGLTAPADLAGYFDAPVKIVPGIRSVEVLPDALRDDPSYFFAGPLIADDVLLGVSGAPAGEPGGFAPLDAFFAANAGRDVVYFTHGLEAPAAAAVVECMRFVLEDGRAVVGSIPSRALEEAYPGRFFHASYLPLHRVCSRAALAVHHCGSATYHYPLLHEVPAITVGTRSCDREDVAVRLEELGASRHLPAPEECGDFTGRFVEAYRECFAAGGEVHARRKECAGRLAGEIRRTAAAFDVEEVLEAAGCM
jgi:hypothetical protein